MKKQHLEASFTVEGAVIVPFILFLSIGVLQLGISFYQESVVGMQDMLLQEIDVVSHFYQLQMLEELGKDIENGT